MPVALVALIPQIIQGIQIAISAAPKVAEIVVSAKALFTSWFNAGLITKAQQDAVHQTIDGIVAMVQAGIVPPHWQVEPDPAATVTTVTSPAPSK